MPEFLKRVSTLHLADPNAQTKNVHEHPWRPFDTETRLVSVSGGMTRSPQEQDCPGAGLVFPASVSDVINPQNRASFGIKRPKSIVAMIQIILSFSLRKTNSIPTLKYFCTVKPQVYVSMTNLIANMWITVSGTMKTLWLSSRLFRNTTRHKTNNTAKHETNDTAPNNTTQNKQHKTNNTTQHKQQLLSQEPGDRMLLPTTLCRRLFFAKDPIRNTDSYYNEPTAMTSGALMRSVRGFLL